MTDDPNTEDEVLDEAVLAEAALESEADAFDEDVFEGDAPVYDTEAILLEAGLARMERKAYWHANQKQLFAFLFANCLFFASAFVAWYRVAPGESPDPSIYIRGVDTIRGAFILAFSIYGFWTAVFNIWHAQMKVWPYMMSAALALWVGIGGFMSGIGGEQWDTAKKYLDSPEFGSKSLFDDLTTPLSVVAPGYWLLTFGGLVVVWVVINGLMQGSASAKASAAEEAASSGRRRRR